LSNFDPPAVVRPAEDLGELAAAINREHEAGEACTRRGLEHYRRAGEALVKAKAQCGHGRWLPWLKANVRFSQQQASRYMQLAKLPVTSNLEDQWRVISGNAPADKPPERRAAPSWDEPAGGEASDRLKAPFPYFGGKGRVARLVWARLGHPDSYIEPFCGSAAVLLARPDPPRTETINDPSCLLSNFDRAAHPERGDPGAVADVVSEVISDADAYLANAWRSIQHAPEDTARWADAMVDECYLHAVHKWLVLGEEAAAFRRRMRQDPDYYDPRRAGRWLYGLCAWIGGGWCQAPEDRHEGGRVWTNTENVPWQGKGVHAKRPCLDGGSRGCLAGSNGRPQLADAYARGRGVHANDDAATCAERRAWLLGWFGRLRDRLRTVRVCCGDWLRVCGSESVTTRLGTTGIFLDPPYGEDAGRDGSLYATDSLTVAADVRAYCLERGGNPAVRIALCGYESEGHEVLEQHGWTVLAWKAAGGYGNRSAKGKENAHRERIWFSPHCQQQATLFDGVA
jgi:hypothetical protein